MDSKPKLSIAIPTWNRAKKLNQLLLTIVTQPELAALKDQFEVVVCDNGSTDGTQALMGFYANEYDIPTIIYLRFGTNRGMDKNICDVINAAHGEYVWLCGDDDAITFGSIKRVLEELESGHDAYVGDCLWCTEDLQPLGVANWYVPELKQTDFNLKNQMAQWLSYIDNDGAAFGFLSTMIFKKEIWKPVPNWFGHSFIHRSLIAARPNLRLIRHNIVAMRSDARYDGPYAGDPLSKGLRDTFGLHMYYLTSWADMCEVLTPEERAQLLGLAWRHMASWFGLDKSQEDLIMWHLYRESPERYREMAVPKLKRLLEGEPNGR